MRGKQFNNDRTPSEITIALIRDEAAAKKATYSFPSKTFETVLFIRILEPGPYFINPDVKNV